VLLAQQKDEVHCNVATQKGSDTQSLMTKSLAVVDLMTMTTLEI